MPTGRMRQGEVAMGSGLAAAALMDSDVCRAPAARHADRTA